MSPMKKQVHAKAPLRLGLAGGGSDVSPYSDRYGGQVLNATISLFTHCHLQASNDGQLHFHAPDHGVSVALDAARPGPHEEPLRLHRAVHARFQQHFHDGQPLPLQVTTFSDAPAGSGVGTSSALVVTLVQAYAQWLQIPLGEYDVARLAYEIERVDCAMAGGKQDQYAAVFGGFNFMEFGAADQVVVNPLRLRREIANHLESRLLLYFTGRSRASARIIESQIASANNGPDSTAVQAMHQIRQSAAEMKEALLKGRVDEVLAILGRSWAAKKQAASGISNAHIDTIAEAALAAGACGLKISGAGGGGFMMIAVEPGRRHAVMQALEPHGGRCFPFAFVEQGVESWTMR